MVKKHYYSWHDIENMCVNIITQMYADNWRPDYIVGITRGGNVPAIIISHMTGIRCESLKISLRDGGGGSETNCWMADDAFGYEFDEVNTESRTVDPKKILVVDDINDTGETFNWLMQDWESSCRPQDERWQSIWGDSVRFAVLTENLSSRFDHVNYSVHEVNKAEEDVWLCYPWEVVGK